MRISTSLSVIKCRHVRPLRSFYEPNGVKTYV